MLDLENEDPDNWLWYGIFLCKILPFISVLIMLETMLAPYLTFQRACI